MKRTLILMFTIALLIAQNWGVAFASSSEHRLVSMKCLIWLNLRSASQLIAMSLNTWNSCEIPKMVETQPSWDGLNPAAELRRMFT